MMYAKVAVSLPDKENVKMRAFSLIEILVCLAVVAMLVAMITAGYNGVMERSSASACMSNLRQISAALFSYAADNNAELPPQYWWSSGASPAALMRGETEPNGLGYLAPYLGANENPVGYNRPRVYRCPGKLGSSLFTYDDKWCSYVYQNPFNQADGSLDPAKPNKTHILKSSWALVIEACQSWAQGGGHGKSTPVVYGDGHLEMRPAIISSSPYGIWPNAFDLTPPPRKL